MNPRPLHVGRSNHSHLIIAWRNLHIFIWTPRRHDTYSYGITIRHRHNTNWTHWRLLLWERHPVKMRAWMQQTRRGRVHVAIRPRLTIFELSRWDTRNGTVERTGLKSYVRLKASAGGREL